MGRRRIATCVALAFWWAIPTGSLCQPQVDLWLEVAPFESGKADRLVTVQPLVTGHDLDSLQLLFSATVDIAFDTDRFEYRAGTGADVSSFVGEGVKACMEKDAPLLDCHSYRPYNLSHTVVDEGSGDPRVRTLIYSSLGYDPDLGEPGLVPAGDTVALSTLYFVRKPTNADALNYLAGKPSAARQDAEDPEESSDTLSFRILEQTTAVSIYGGRDERGGIGHYVDCSTREPHCRLKVFHTPFFRAGED